jgi:hypothetical protein
VKRWSVRSGNGYRHSAPDFQYLYDVRLVRAPEAPFHGNGGGNFSKLADRFGRILFPGTRQPPGLYQLKIIQEAITLVVFAVFAYFYLGESFRWNYAVSFALVMAAVAFAFWGRT